VYLGSAQIWECSGINGNSANLNISSFSTSYPVVFRGGTTEWGRFDATTGNVGIGTSTPGAYKLYVNGPIRSDDNLYVAAGGAHIARGASTSPALTVNKASSGPIIDFQSSSASKLYLDFIGNLGIGTTAPSEKSEVVGNQKVSGNDIHTAIPGTDHTTSGQVIALTATANSAIGDVIYIASTGKATFCKADAIANCPYALAICADATINADASGNWLTHGSIRDDTWAWTVGGLIYVSTTGTTGNTLTQTAPSGANNVIIPVGVALSADVMYFFGNLTTIEHN